MAFQNTGQESVKIIQEKAADTGLLTGRIMPNIAQIHADAIISSPNTITFNYPSDVTPSGGIDGNIIYNGGSDTLYKKIAGVWTILTPRVTNDYFIPSVANLTNCPI